ncbi:MAG: ribonuclease H-like domain-containing protein [Spirochaetes bacterium]|nr:ribonuclease H-like domain-containing protein [Spirochaetota bacterium]
MQVRLIGEKREQQLWASGISAWKDLLPNIDRVDMPARVIEQLKRGIAESAERLDAKDYLYFANRLRHKHLYRVYPYLADRTLYIDIETTGGRGGAPATITLIGCFDGTTARVFIAGRDLYEFRRYIEAYDLVVTFNGTSFDIPSIEKALRFTVRQPHIDLRVELTALGITDGLKKLEKVIGIERPSGIDELNGFSAVLLWERYKRKKDQAALDTLIHYNLTDAVSLEALMRYTYNKRMERYGFNEYCIPEKPVPGIDHPYSPAVVEQVLVVTRRVTGKKTKKPPDPGASEEKAN